MNHRLSLIVITCAASTLATRAANIAQFNPGAPKPPATIYPSNNTPAPVAFVPGSPLNPTGSHFFTVAIGNSITPTHPSGTPAWSLTSGVPGLPSGTTISQANLSPIIIGMLNTTDGLDVLAFKGGIGSVVTMTLDFTNLPGGFLPAGSVLAYSDVDFLESTTLTGSNGWFNLSTIVPMDVTNGVVTGTGQPDTTPLDWTNYSGAGGTLTLTGASRETDSPGVFIPLATDLTSLTIVAHSNTNMADFYQSLSIAAIPEPSVLLLSLGAPLALLRRNRMRP